MLRAVDDHRRAKAQRAEKDRERRAAATIAASSPKRSENAGEAAGGAWSQRDVVAEAQRRIEQARNVVGKLANQSLSKAWMAWMELVEARQAAWDLLDRVASRWVYIGRARAWSQPVAATPRRGPEIVVDWSR